jgi:hypothetical protein
MKSTKSLLSLTAGIMAFAMLGAPAVAFAHPTLTAHTHTIPAHDHDHTQQPHIKTISAHHTH